MSPVNRMRKGPVIDPGLCRCCGTIKKCRLLNSEYDYIGQVEVYSDMFVDCFGLLLSHLDGDEKDRLICATCVSRLREASSFRKQVLHCEQILLESKLQLDNSSCVKQEAEVEMKYFNDSKIRNEETDALKDNVNAQVMLDTLKQEKAVEDNGLIFDEPEYFEDADNISDDDQPLQNLSSKPPKKATRKYMESKSKVRSKGVTVPKKSIKNKVKNGQLQPNKVVPPGMNFMQNKKALSNLITIVENSYACPFNTFYSFYYCVYCRNKYFDPDKLREHNLTHDASTYKDLRCLTYKKKFQIDIVRIDCRLCPEKIDSIDKFKCHITKAHGKKLHPISNEFLQFRLTSNFLECTECGKKYTAFHDLKKHMAVHFAAYICDMCGLHYFEERMLVAHLKTHQPNTLNFPCKECGKCFKVKYNLQVHVARVHTNEAVYLCSKCDETFFSNTVRDKHMILVHGEESSFKCEHCDKVYDTKKKLRDHSRRIHMKMSKHECQLCGKSFYLPSRLKEHMACHTGERNFRCEHCGKSYQRLRTLKVHVQSHSIDKKYKCKFCSASYTQNVCLKNHVKRQHQSLESEESFQG